MSRIKTFEQTEWALSVDAKRALDELEKAGWDRDLALATLEGSVGAESMYQLDDAEEVDNE